MNDIPFRSVFAGPMNQFLQLRAAVLKERTITVGRRQLKSFDGYLAANSIHTITKDAVDGWIGTVRGSDSTVVHAVCTIRLFIEYLAGSGIEAYIPDVPKQHDDYVPYIFSEEETALIIRAADSYPSRWNNSVPYMQAMLPVIIRIALCCGLRISEAVCLKRKNFNSDDGILTIENSKNGRQRIVPMHGSLTEILVKYCLAAGIPGKPEAWLFPGIDDSVHVESAKIYFRFAYILETAGITVSKEKYERGPCFHCLRHTFVLRSFRQLEAMGVSTDNSVPYLSIYLGHNSLKETERYMKFTTDMFADEFQKFAAFSRGVFPEVCYED